MTVFNKKDWYWQVGDDTSRAFSTKHMRWVASGEDDLMRFKWNQRPTIVPDEDTLWDIIYPEFVTNYQARAILRRVPGRFGGPSLFAEIDGALKQMGGDALEAWEYANNVYRKGAFVKQLAAQFGLTQQEVNELFRLAEAIE